MLHEFKLDYNQKHFVRNETFKKAADSIQVQMAVYILTRITCAVAHLPCLGLPGQKPRIQRPINEHGFDTTQDHLNNALRLCAAGPRAEDLHRVPRALLHSRVLGLPAVQGAWAAAEEDQPGGS